MSVLKTEEHVSDCTTDRINTHWEGVVAVITQGKSE